MRRYSSTLVAALLACGAPLAAEDVQRQDRPELALMGTIPIYWGEAASIDEVLSGSATPHWARGVLESDFELAPIDYLSAHALGSRRYLLMAQPRGLTPEENLALDQWVRSGGTLLLFADPMMTGESRFPLGDRRRPQDVVLLSPILARWGLELRFDPDQLEGLQVVDHFGVAVPVNMRGELQVLEGMNSCATPDHRLLALCAIEEGLVVVVADAAMLDLHGPPDQAAAALTRLTALFGDHAGIATDSAMVSAQTGDLVQESATNGPALRDENQAEGN